MLLALQGEEQSTVGWLPSTAGVQVAIIIGSAAIGLCVSRRPVRLQQSRHYGIVLLMQACQILSMPVLSESLDGTRVLAIHHGAVRYRLRSFLAMRGCTAPFEPCTFPSTPGVR